MRLQACPDTTPTIVNFPVARSREYLTRGEVEKLMAGARKSSRYGDRDAAIAQVCLAPTVSAITAPRAPKGFSSPTVESRAV
jgi:hypothetical protein